MRFLKMLSVLVAFALPIAAFAHGGAPHILGTVKNVDGNVLTVEAKNHRSTKVLLDERTRFEKDGAEASAKDLEAGERVVVHTTKKAGSTELVAVLVKFTAAPPATASAKPAPTAEEASAQTITLSVTEAGFTPNKLQVKQGQPVRLVVTRTTDETCAKAITIADYGVKRDLPLNKPVTIVFTPKKSGDIAYSCAMGMMGGVLSVE